MSKGRIFRNVVTSQAGVIFLVTLHSEKLKHPIRVSSSWIATKSRGEVYEPFPFGVKMEDDGVFVIWDAPGERLAGVLNEVRVELEVVDLKNPNKVLCYAERVALVERKGVKGGKKGR